MQSGPSSSICTVCVYESLARDTLEWIEPLGSGSLPSRLWEREGSFKLTHYQPMGETQLREASIPGLYFLILSLPLSSRRGKCLPRTRIECPRFCQFPDCRNVKVPSPRRPNLFPVTKIPLLPDCQMPWAANCSPTLGIAILSLSHNIARKVERLGTSTRKDLHVLCYQHHTEMLLGPPSDSAEGTLYACREPGCLIRYFVSSGYFLDMKDAKAAEPEIIPRVSCSNDAQHMYLAEVMAERKSFRLWKCPQCDARKTNEEITGGLGKKTGA